MDVYAHKHKEGGDDERLRYIRKRREEKEA